MFKKNNKPIQQQSSESDISSQNQLPHKVQNKNMLYEPSSDNQDYLDSRQQQQQESQDQQQQEDIKKSQINNKKLLNSQQSQEQESQQQQDSSDDGGHAYFRNKQAHGIHTIREDPKQSLEDDSIDHIQQRIKKLQKDLETRLQKHTQIPEQKNHGKIIKPVSHPPPVPQKKTLNQENQNKMNNGNQIQIPIRKESIPQKKQEPKKQYDEITPAQSILPKQKKNKKQNPQIHQAKIQLKKSINTTIQNKPKLKKQQPKSLKNEQKNNQFYSDHTNNFQLQQKMNQMAKTMKQLKLQNQILKQKLEAQQSKKQKSKHKTIQELERIKQAASSTSNNKLEKQIQLLQVIQKLQVKLKKSINRKLSKQTKTSTTHLHKGLTNSIQNCL